MEHYIEQRRRLAVVNAAINYGKERMSYTPTHPRIKMSPSLLHVTVLPPDFYITMT